MIYLWLFSNEYPESLVGKYDKENSPNRFLFQKAQKVTLDTVPTVHFKASVKNLRKYDDLNNNAMVPIVSPSVVDILIGKKAEVQFIDVNVIASDGVIEDYKILNLLKKESALDRDKSEFDLFPGTQQIMGFDKLAYKDVDLILARDSDYLPYILVNEELGDSLKENCNCVGIYKPEQLQYGVVT